LRDPDADHGGVDDMTKLAYLNEPGVLYNLERRYALDSIYVSELKFYFSNVLIMVNVIINCLDDLEFHGLLWKFL